MKNWYKKYFVYFTYSLVFICGFIICTFIFSKDKGYSAMFPRMRVNRSASLTLSTTYQKIDWTGTSALNTNNFGIDPSTGNPLVYWDPVNKIFKFYNTMDVNYFMYFTGRASCTLLTTPVSLRYRFVIPNGTSPGVPFYFPNGDTGQDNYSDLGPLSFTGTRPFDQAIPVYVNQLIRTNGFYLEVAISNGTLGTCTMDYCALNILSAAPSN